MQKWHEYIAIHMNIPSEGTLSSYLCNMINDFEIYRVIIYYLDAQLYQFVC